MAGKDTVIMVIPHYGFGGAQRVFAQLVTSLNDVFDIHEVIFDQGYQEVYGSNGKKFSLDVAAGKSLTSKAMRFLERCWKLARLKRRQRPIVTISHLEGANFINVLSRGPGRTIICVHGSKTAFDSNRTGFVRFLENHLLTPILFRFASKIVVVSHGISRELQDTFHIPSRRISVIQNGIPTKKILSLCMEPISEKLNQLFDRKVVVFSGRLVDQKNPLPLVHIYQHALRSIDFSLLVVGDGLLKGEMQERCQESGVPWWDVSDGGSVPDYAGIFFLGFELNPFKYIARSSIFVSTSNFEGFPMALCEALACQTTIMATDCPTGVREILCLGERLGNFDLKIVEYGEYGVLMPMIPFDELYGSKVTLWANTLVSLLNDEDMLRRYQLKGASRAAELDESDTIKKWKAVIAEVGSNSY